MDRKRKRRNNKSLMQFMILACIILLTCCLSIGYAEVNTVILNLDGKVSAQPINELIITDIQYDTSNDADLMNSLIHQFNGTNMESTIALTDNADSSITYNITMYNGDTQSHIFKEVEYLNECYDNPNIVFELNGLKPDDVINKYKTITFSITFHYLDGTVPENKVLNSYLNFKFEKATDVSDDGIIINTAQVEIYDASSHKIPIEIVNNNQYNVNLNLKFDNTILAEISVEPLQTKKLEVSVQDFLSQIDLNKKYTILMEVTQPATGIEKQTGIEFTVYPTITNFTLGCKEAGTENNPYIIYKIEDLVRFAQKVNKGTTFLNKYVKLKDDINFGLSDDYYNSEDITFGNLNGNASDGNKILTEMTTGTGFIGIGKTEGYSFQGIFLGNQKEIKNIYINSTATNIRMALFVCIKNAEIQDLTVKGKYTVVGDAAGLVGTLYGNSIITNCHNQVNITNETVGHTLAGLLVICERNSEATITGSSNSGNMISVSMASGLVGLVSTSAKISLSNCYNTGSITSTETATSGTNYDRTATAGLVAKDLQTSSQIIIEKSYNEGTISGMKLVGGLVGTSQGECTINSSYNVGSVIGKSVRIGGILGEKRGVSTNIQNTYNAGSVSGEPNASGELSVGGIVGLIYGVSCDISTAYYLDNINSAIGSDGTATAGSRTDEFMKSDDFVTLLGTYFEKDTAIINNGYPILKKIIIP